MQKATFGAGCFWGVEYRFSQLNGVLTTCVGYEGGHTDNPSYKEVCTDHTGHAEVVELDYDENLITYEDLLKAFWDMHDPTTPNRQGPDVGSQYRSVIFYHSDTQKEAAEKMKADLDRSGKFTKPIVTLIVPAGQFYKAEEYHQKYLKKQGKTSCDF